MRRRMRMTAIHQWQCQETANTSSSNNTSVGTVEDLSAGGFDTNNIENLFIVEFVSTNLLRIAKKKLKYGRGERKIRATEVLGRDVNRRTAYTSNMYAVLSINKYRSVQDDDGVAGIIGSNVRNYCM